MAVPFRRKSSTRIRKGRAPSNWKFQKKFSLQSLVKCSNCQEIKLLHHACSFCHTYRRRKVKEEISKLEKK